MLYLLFTFSSIFVPVPIKWTNGGIRIILLFLWIVCVCVHMTSTQMSIRYFPLACKRITCHGSNFICVEAREIKHNCFACLFSTDAFLLWKYRKKCLYKEEICSCRLMYNNHGNMCSNPIVFIKQHQQQQFFCILFSFSQ